MKDLTLIIPSKERDLRVSSIFLKELKKYKCKKNCFTKG